MKKYLLSLMILFGALFLFAGCSAPEVIGTWTLSQVAVGGVPLSERDSALLYGHVFFAFDEGSNMMFHELDDERFGVYQLIEDYPMIEEQDGESKEVKRDVVSVTFQDGSQSLLVFQGKKLVFEEGNYTWSFTKRSDAIMTAEEVAAGAVPAVEEEQ